MLTILAKLLKALNSEASPSQISLAIVFGMILGLTPLWSVHNILVVFVVLILRINITSFIVAWGAFSAIAYLLDPAFIGAGEGLLAREELRSFWTSMYKIDAWRITRFNNTLTLGSLVVALVLAVPLFFVSHLLIKKYREKVLVWVQKSKLAQVLRASKLYRIYISLSGRGMSV